MSWRVSALLGASPRPFRDGEQSAIAKQLLPGRIAITTLGLVGDDQADKVHHGGPHMAVHVYPLDHHAFWHSELGDHPLLDQPGAFGSNLAISGIAEADLAIGDRFRLGSALLEVSRPRQPCWKIEHRFGTMGMVRAILQTGRCGWYFRVLEEGSAEAGDMLEPVEQASTGWTVARTFAALWSPQFDDRETALRELVDLAPLAQGLRAQIAARL